MNPALLYLSVRSVRGRIVRALRLLKEPKYLIGVLVFVGWMGFWMSSAFIFDDDGDMNVQFGGTEILLRVMGDAVPALQLIVAVALALGLSLWWLLPWSRMALNLSEPEIHMLTPMPVERRHLIQYATLKSQPGILFGCIMMTVFVGTGGSLARLGWFGAFWLVLTVWDLHSKGRALWLERQKELAPASAWRNRLLLVGAIVLYWIVLGAALSELIAELMTLRPLPDQRTVDFVRETLIAFRPRLESGVIGWLLLPFRWVTAPVFLAVPGADLQLRLTGLVMPLVLLVAHNEWVVRSRAKFEEAALAHARREAKKKSTGARYWKTSMRSRRRTSFPLPPRGRPEVAILWKNALQVTRFSLRSLVLFGVAVIGTSLLLCLVAPWRGVPLIFLWIGAMTMLLSPLTGAQSYRNDLRTDLQRLEMVRPWPIAGWKLFAAEAAGPALFGLLTAAFGAGLVLTVDLYLTVDRTLLSSINAAEMRFSPDQVAQLLGVPQPLMVTLILLGVLPPLIGMTCLSVALQNLLVLLFPGWVHLGSDKQQGAAAFGQNMIMFFGLGLAAMICLLPAALLIGAIVLLQRFAFGLSVIAWEFPAFGIVAATPFFAVVALIVRAGGGVWERLDASQEILEGSS